MSKSNGSARKLPFVWELEKDGVTSYSLGTYHFLSVDFSREISTLIAKVKKVAVEFNAGEPGAMEQFRSLCAARLIWRPEFLRIIEQVLYRGIRASPNVDHLHAFSSFVVKETYKEPQFLDAKVEEEARRQDKVVHGLGDAYEHAERYAHAQADFQRRVLDALSRKGDIVEEMKNELRKSETDYLSGDEARVITDKDREIGRIPAMQRMNEEIAFRSLVLLKDPTLVAVGVGHYLGESSVLKTYEKN